jgi:hypothetical protein
VTPAGRSSWATVKPGKMLMILLDALNIYYTVRDRKLMENFGYPVLQSLNWKNVLSSFWRFSL